MAVNAFRLGLGALLLVGCGGANMKSYTPISEKTKIAPEMLFTAARRALEAKGYDVIRSDPETYTLLTKEKETYVSSVPRLSYKYQWTIVTAEGKLSISVSCKENSSMERTAYQDCGDERPSRVIDEQDDLRKEILQRAKKK
jgi:hypothetical protein